MRASSLIRKKSFEKRSKLRWKLLKLIVRIRINCCKVSKNTLLKISVQTDNGRELLIGYGTNNLPCVQILLTFNRACRLTKSENINHFLLQIGFFVIYSKHFQQTMFLQVFHTTRQWNLLLNACINLIEFYKSYLTRNIIAHWPKNYQITVGDLRKKN